MDRLRSLNIEHVSPARLIRPEICPPDASSERATALFRKWFWARKPDAGFALCGFPATLLQAMVFDEWLDARDETLDAVFAFAPVVDPGLAEHYRTLGLLPMEASLSS